MSQDKLNCAYTTSSKIRVYLSTAAMCVNDWPHRVTGEWEKHSKRLKRSTNTTNYHLLAYASFCRENRRVIEIMKQNQPLKICRSRINANNAINQRSMQKSNQQLSDLEHNQILIVYFWMSYKDPSFWLNLLRFFESSKNFRKDYSLT